jgi:uncharacterized protein YjbI with pentapeptide repeats
VRRDKAIEELLRLIDGNRVVKVSASSYFAGGVENEEQLDQALGRAQGAVPGADRGWQEGYICQIVNGNASILKHQNIDLRDTDLFGADFSGCDLRGIDFTASRLGGVRIDAQTKLDEKWQLVWQIHNAFEALPCTTHLNLSGANLSGLDLSGQDLSYSNLHKSVLRYTNLSKTNLSYTTLSEADLFRANLRATILHDAIIDDRWRALIHCLSRPDEVVTNLRGIDLSGADLRGIKLSGDLNGTQFSGSNLIQATFLSASVLGMAIDPDTQLDRRILAIWQLCNLKALQDEFNAEIFVAADFFNWTLTGTPFHGMDLRNADFSYGTLHECDFSGANLSGASFECASLKFANLEGARLSNAKFGGAQLEKAKLRGAIITEETQMSQKWRDVVTLLSSHAKDASLEDRDLSGADLAGTVLPGIDLVEFKCRETNFEGSDLSDARMDRADLDGAVLREANLTGVSLAGANLSHVDLRGARLSNADLRWACWKQVELDSETELSDKWRFVWACVNNEPLDNLETPEDLDDADLRGANLSALGNINLRNTLIDAETKFKDAEPWLWLALNGDSDQGVPDFLKNNEKFYRGGRRRFVGANLVGAVLSGANLSNVDFSGANLSEARLDDANLSKAIFRRATLKNASLRKANLYNSVLEDADLTLARFHGANLKRATLSNVRFDPKAHNVFEDGTDQMELGSRDKVINWSLLRFIGKLPLFAISWTAFGISLATIKAIDYANNNIEMFRNVPIRPSYDMLWFIVLTFSLVIGSSIYKFFCPARIQEFSEAEWVDIHGHPRMQYIADKTSRRLAQWPTLIFTAFGGLVALLMIGGKLLIAVRYLAAGVS